jgi:hypothetical protein
MEPAAVGCLGPMLQGGEHLRRHPFVPKPAADVLVQRPLRGKGALQVSSILPGYRAAA